PRRLKNSPIMMPMTTRMINVRMAVVTMGMTSSLSRKPRLIDSHFSSAEVHRPYQNEARMQPKHTVQFEERCFCGAVNRSDPLPVCPLRGVDSRFHSWSGEPRSSSSRGDNSDPGVRLRGDP